MKRLNDLYKIISVIIILAIITALVPVSSPVLSPVCLAATESKVTFPFPDVDGVNITVTFPHGEGIKYETGYNIPGVYSWSFVVIYVRPLSVELNEAQANINVVTQASMKWRLLYSRNMGDPDADSVKKGWDEPPKEYTLCWTKTPTKNNGDFYFIEVRTPQGDKKVFFILLPLEQEVVSVQADYHNLTLKHYAPFFIPPKGSERRAGDIVAKVTDSKTNIPVAGKKVFVYLESGSNLEAIICKGWELSAIISRSSWWGEWANNYKRYWGAPSYYSLIGWGTTDARGEFVVNYYFALGQNVKQFAQELKTNKTLSGKVWAVTVGSGTNDPQNYASIDIEFKGVAELIEIDYEKDERLNSKKPFVTVISGGTETEITDKELPHYLLPGDKVKLEDGDLIDIVWATGLKMKIKPKSGKSGEVEICDERAGWWATYSAKVNYIAVGFILSGAGFVASALSLAATAWGVVTVSAATAAAAAAASAVTGIASLVFGLPCIIAYGYNYWGTGLEYSVHSTILMDMDGIEQESTTYVVEGKIVLDGVDATNTEVTGGHKITISSEGVPSPVSSFNISELSDELLSLLTDTTSDSTSTASGLTFESRSKPQGTEVQIPLTLSEVPDTIGNLDLNLSYDPSVLEATDVIKGGLCDNSIMESNITPGSVRIALADGNGFTGDGSVVYIKFKVIGAEGASSPLNIDANSANRQDYGEAALPTNNGVFQVSTVSESQGDWDGNRKLTPLDALAALQMAVGKRAVDLTLDMNADGKVTSLDARNILKTALQGE